jgi:hypothetical protein
MLTLHLVIIRSKSIPFSNSKNFLSTIISSVTVAIIKLSGVYFINRVQNNGLPVEHCNQPIEKGEKTKCQSIGLIQRRAKMPLIKQPAVDGGTNEPD